MQAQAAPFSEYLYEKILTESSRVLVFASFDKKIKHIAGEKGVTTNTRRLVQPYIMSLDDRLDYELLYTPLSTLSICGSRSSDRAFIPVFAAIEAASNVLAINGVEVFHSPVRIGDVEIQPYNIFTPEACYIEEWEPRKKWYQTHWERPRINALSGVYKAAQEFVYDLRMKTTEV